MSDDELPAFLTVEEAARVLRIGRTKAYAMATEWRVTGGKSGMPVRDFGGVLRVPLAAIKEMAGGELDPALVRAAISRPKLATVPEPVIDLTESDSVIDLTEPDSAPAPTPERRPARGARRQPKAQLDLFDLPPAS